MNLFIIGKKISIIKRLRIKENRDLINGLRLNRNERVENYPKNTLSKIFSKVNDYDLGKYPDQNNIYKILSKFLRIKEKNLIITSGIDGSIKSIFEIFTNIGDKIAILHQLTLCMKFIAEYFKRNFLK